VKYNLKTRPRMKLGNMDRTLFFGKEVEEWFVGFERELRDILRKEEAKEDSEYLAEDLIREVLGE
jgi:hypothetical protein